MSHSKSDCSPVFTQVSADNVDASGFQLSRRGFMVLASASMASLLLPQVTRAAAPTFNISLAGELRSAFAAYLAYDRGDSSNPATYSGKVTIDNTTYQISIDTELCRRTGESGKIIANLDSLYLHDLIDVARSVPGESISVRALS